MEYFFGISRVTLFLNALFVRLLFLIIFPALLILSSHSKAIAESSVQSHIEGIYGLLEGKVGLSGKKRSSESISAELGEILGEIESISSWKDKTSQDVQQTMERIKDLRSALKDIRDNIWWYFKKN